MTAKSVIAEIETLPPAERAKVIAYVGRVMETDDSWIPESFKQGMAEAATGKLIDRDTVLSGVNRKRRSRCAS